LCRKQPTDLNFHHLIAFARTGFQARSVKDRDAALGVQDEPQLSQLTQSRTHSFTTRTHHGGKRLLRYAQIVGSYAVVEKEQPSTKALFRGMKAVADSQLRDLSNQGSDVSQQQELQWISVRRLLSQCLRPYSERIAVDEHDGTMENGVAIQEEIYPDNPVASHYTLERARSFFGRVNKRNDRGKREVDVVQMLPWLLNNLTNRESNQLPTCAKTFTVFQRKGRQDAVLPQEAKVRDGSHQPIRLLNTLGHQIGTIIGASPFGCCGPFSVSLSGLV